jgi:uncharacterized protein YoxC
MSKVNADVALSCFTSKWLLVIVIAILVVHSIRTINRVEKPLNQITATLEQHTKTLAVHTTQLDVLTNSLSKNTLNEFATRLQENLNAIRNP